MDGILPSSCEIRPLKCLRCVRRGCGYGRGATGEDDLGRAIFCFEFVWGDGQPQRQSLRPGSQLTAQWSPRPGSQLTAHRSPRPGSVSLQAGGRTGGAREFRKGERGDAAAAHAPRRVEGALTHVNGDRQHKVRHNDVGPPALASAACVHALRLNAVGSHG
eukprot:360736-Chlamydomonas_euryale.AAC.2